MARRGFGLSRELWLVQFGIFLNYLGYGAVLPFEVIYLHDGRGVSLGVAGLVVGLITGVAVVIAPVADPLIDRTRGRRKRRAESRQSTLLATLAATEVHHRAAAVSRVDSNAGIGIGGALGGLVAGYGQTGFVALFLANALTYLIYVLVFDLCRAGDSPMPPGRRLARAVKPWPCPPLHPLLDSPLWES